MYFLLFCFCLFPSAPSFYFNLFPHKVNYLSCDVGPTVNMYCLIDFQHFLKLIKAKNLDARNSLSSEYRSEGLDDGEFGATVQFPDLSSHR